MPEAPGTSHVMQLVIAHKWLVAVTLTLGWAEVVRGNIPPEDLYAHFFPDNPLCKAADFEPTLNDPTGRSLYTCWRNADQKIDFNCRYMRGIRCGCYCCGQTVYFIEHGSVCSRFCRLENRESNGTGLRPIINLPNRWNENPGLLAPLTQVREEPGRLCSEVGKLSEVVLRNEYGGLKDVQPEDLTPVLGDQSGNDAEEDSLDGSSNPDGGSGNPVGGNTDSIRDTDTLATSVAIKAGTRKTTKLEDTTTIQTTTSTETTKSSSKKSNKVLFPMENIDSTSNVPDQESSGSVGTSPAPDSTIKPEGFNRQETSSASNSRPPPSESIADNYPDDDNIVFPEEIVSTPKET